MDFRFAAININCLIAPDLRGFFIVEKGFTLILYMVII